MPKKRKYGNILDVPLSINLLSAGSEEWARQRDADLLLREKALFQEYGLARPAELAPDVRKLIQMMACDLNIKGFMEKNDIKSVGRPTKWKDFNEMLLLFARVRSMQQRNPEMDLRSVIRNITNKYYPKNNPDGIYARYNELLKSGTVEMKAIQTILDVFSKKNIEKLANDMGKLLYENK